MKLNMGKPSYSYAGKIAWALVWVALGAMAGTLFWKLRDPRAPEPGPEVVTGDAIPAPGQTVAAGGSPEPAGAQTVAGLTPEPLPGATPITPINPDTVPTISSAEVDREMIKKTVFDYYDALSRDDDQAAASLWATAGANVKKNIDLAIKGFDQIVVIPETFDIKALTDAEAQVAFTIKAYLKNGQAKSYNKEAMLTKSGSAWKIVSTQNPK